MLIAWIGHGKMPTAWIGHGKNGSGVGCAGGAVHGAHTCTGVPGFQVC